MWRPIDTIPDNIIEAIVFGFPNGEINGPWDHPVATVADRGWHGGGWSVTVTDAYSVVIDPTHWMPLPAPPDDHKA